MQKINDMVGKLKIRQGVLIAAGIIVTLCILGLCSSAVISAINPTPQPTIDIDAINTSAMQTAGAPYTQTAITSGKELSVTPTPSPTAIIVPTIIPASTSTPIPTMTPTIFISVLPTVAPTSYSGGSLGNGSSGNGSSGSGSSGSGSSSGGCCKVCSNSQPCGDACISLKYTCHKPRGCACP
jgi:uncharacterized membrane protein YgcG